ncbi:MAG: hypothetical protein J6V44_12835 [Methanobrevibacter sp.]|jgi:hypothetical protein|nr:hypothetical protein [Methanobrevibacter sp.]
MINEQLFLNDGSLFATKYNRVVHGQRGDYIELEKEHIIPELVSKFNNDLSKPADFYYFWLHPKDKSDYKVYLQLKTVKYADYKIGKYYISPDLIKDFKDPECLF